MSEERRISDDEGLAALMQGGPVETLASWCDQMGRDIGLLVTLARYLHLKPYYTMAERGEFDG